MKYNLKNRKYWKSWLRQDFWRWIYKNIYKFNMSVFNDGTMIPNTGKGKFVSVYTKGQIIQIIDERNENDEIRIIPYQPNHGVMVEKIRDGKVRGRCHLDIEMLNNSILYSSNLKQLLEEKKLQRKIKLKNIESESHL